MKKWWQSYKSKPIREKRKPSITKDPVALLDERLQFFTPNFDNTYSFTEAFLYMFSWSVFVTNVQLTLFLTWDEYLYTLLFTFLVTTLTVVPIVIFINVSRETLKRLSILQSSIRIVLLAIAVSVMSVFIILPVVDLLGIREINIYRIILEAVTHAANVTGFVIVFLLYYLRNYRDLTALRTSFERRLEEQNDNIKSRIAPHFFFNTINSLVSLIETDPNKASLLLQHISHVFRASFSEPREYSLEEEIQLCEHYITTEKYRLNDKLKVTWILPEEDMLYDMTITSLTLQSVLEQTVLHIVERTLDTVHIDIKITWENHTAMIIVQANLPKNTLMVSHDIQRRINFRVQERRLKEHFGDTARIDTAIEEHLYTNVITYPLYDAMI